MESKNNLYNKLLKEYLSIKLKSKESSNTKKVPVKPTTVKPTTESELNLSEIFTKELNKSQPISSTVKVTEDHQVDDQKNSMETSEIELSEIYTDKQTSKDDNLILINENIKSVYSQHSEKETDKPETIKPDTVKPDTVKPKTNEELKPIATTSTLGITLITPPRLLTKTLSTIPINLSSSPKPPGFSNESGEELLRSLGISQEVNSNQTDLRKELDIQSVSKPQPKITPTLLPPSLQMAFKGGMSVELFDNIFDDIFDDNQPTLKYIMSYYFKHYREQINSKIIPKILNNNEIIMVMVACLYAYFIEKKYTKIDEIINIEFISIIPEHFTFNFLNLINQQLEQSSETPKIKKYLDDMSITLKNKIYSRIYHNNKIPAELLKYIPDDYTITVAILKQNGGGKIDISVKINNKINKLSETLKKQSKQTGGKNSLFHSITHEINKYVKLIKDVTKYHKQIGGNLIRDINKEKENADEQLKKIADDTQRVKIHKQKIVEKANMWSIQLVDENYAIKTIEDNDYGIARFVLIPTKEYEKVTELKAVLSFINGTASILTFKNESTSDSFPVVLKVEKLGPVQPTYITDKLTTYFEKKYNELQKLKENNRQKDSELKKEEGIFEQIKKFLGFRGGADGQLKTPKGNDNFLEYCFTSRQYNKFLEKMEEYLKANGKTIEIEELKSLKDEIEQVKKIEDKLVELNKLLINYKLINDEFPDYITKDVTIQHMKNILKSNDSLIDDYGNVNLKTLKTVKNIEKLIKLKEEINNRQQFSQSGGHVESKNFSKKYMSYNDYKFFISDSMKQVLEQINSGEKEVIGGKKNSN
jgi:hypothetical protein